MFGRNLSRFGKLARIWWGAGELAVSGASLSLFRRFFGLMMAVATVRFWSRGWIDEIILDPPFHFHYFGFEWVQPLPATWTYLQFGLMTATSLAVAVGYRTRLNCLLFFFLFSWVELIELSAYLNHYYFVSILALIFAALPEGKQLKRKHYRFLQAQVALVYFFAGFAKLNEDWLLHAEPLTTWMRNFGDWPLVGEALSSPTTAVCMSWGGAFYDLTIFAWLIWRPTRRVAYFAVIVFHTLVGILFPIGVFPWVMALAATVFFEPDWPAALQRRLSNHTEPKATRSPPRNNSTPQPVSRIAKWATLGAIVWLVIQVLVPLRFLLYPGQVNWTEQGFRFAWRVMLVEKTGHVEFRVRSTQLEASSKPGDRKSGEQRIFPRNDMTRLQYRQMSTQPDMIQQYANRLKRQYERGGHDHVQVFVDAFISLNARPSQRAIDPNVDLGSIPAQLAPADWILPLQSHNDTR